ncbi:MAG: AraC family transcriptional regulator [Lachnospiraceae bacterium]|nr:AraC family transcriptional regulator [Lachnospiraceae bacterium]MDE7028385.1 AraC family transcriptional regulator [Lachnospiraceae bacterium]
MKFYNFLTNAEQTQRLSGDRQEQPLYENMQFPCAAGVDLYCADASLWHWHDEMEVGFVRSGSLTVCVNDAQFLLREGEGIFVNTGVLHAYMDNKCTNAVFPNIVFLPVLVYGSRESVFWTDYVRPLTQAVRLSHLIFTKEIFWQAEVLKGIERTVQLFAQGVSGSEFAVRAQLSDMVCRICQHSQEQLWGSGHKDIEIERLRRMLAFVDAQYSKPVQLQQIADSAFVSCRECQRLFQKVIGTSPRQYVIQLRLQKARQMLTESSASICDICDRCGFQDQSYFTKVFRERFGMPPAKFRRQYMYEG